MNIVADDKIPFISHFFETHGKIAYFPGENITQSQLKNADLLLTRTVTPVNQALLENTSVRLIGTATTGTDHIDTAWLRKQNIALATSAGANTDAVVDYVAFCLAALKKNNYLVGKKVVGIIGCGRIGRRVAQLFQSHGFEVLCFDPLLAEKLSFDFVSLEKLMREADIISIHTPLTKTGLHPTFHLLNDYFLQKIKLNSIIINTARGSVIDQHALLQVCDKKNILLCLDVWENEPHISQELLSKVIIGTPHIAGYSLQAKYRATEMIYDAAVDFFQWKKIKKEVLVLQKNNANDYYDPIAHTQLFRDAILSGKAREEIGEIFVRERTGYLLR